MSTALSYDELQQEIVQELQKHKVGVLATAEGNSVTARSMSLIFDGLTSSCFTNAHSRKARQIAANERVALAIDNIQIEGWAKLKGRTTDPKNAGFLKAYEKAQPEVYEWYRGILLNPEFSTEVIEVTAERVAVFVGMPEPHTDVLNTVTKTATRYSAGEWPEQ